MPAEMQRRGGGATACVVAVNFRRPFNTRPHARVCVGGGVIMGPLLLTIPLPSSLMRACVVCMHAGVLKLYSREGLPSFRPLSAALVHRVRVTAHVGVGTVGEACGAVLAIVWRQLYRSRVCVLRAPVAHPSCAPSPPASRAWLAAQRQAPLSPAGPPPPRPSNAWGAASPASSGGGAHGWRAASRHPPPAQRALPCAT